MSERVDPINELPSKKELITQIRLTAEIVWKKQLDQTDIDAWLGNFKGEVFDESYEKHIALWLLANFVFYNDDEVKHLCRTLYRDFVHEFIDSDSTNPIEDRYKELLKRSRFYHLGRPGESSGYVLYYFRQENKLPIGNFLGTMEDLPSTIDTVVFVDDVVLSADEKSQADLYLKKLMEKFETLKDKRIIVLSFIATTEARDYLKSQGYEVVNCITLSERNKCFSDKSLVFNEFQDHLENAKKMASHYGDKIEVTDPLGFNNCQLLFGFFYNTPNNTLPIFWAEKNGWIPILKRYQKNYYKKLERLGKFV